MSQEEVELRQLRDTVRPLIVHIPGIPPGICGSCFVLGYRGRLFAVTAAHVTRGTFSQHVLVMADSDTRNGFRLGAGVQVWPPGEKDGLDLVVYPTGLTGFRKETLSAARILNMEDPGITAWQQSAYVAEFLVVGFPRVLNEVDYERKVFKTAQVMMSAQYECVTRVDGHMHRLQVFNQHELADFAGFSGGPVFSVERRLASTPALRLCGVALMGSPSRNIVHFIDAAALKFVLDTAIGHLTGDGGHVGPPPDKYL